MMVAIHNLCVEYGYHTVKQTYGNVLNNVVKVTNGFWVLLAITYVAIRIMEDIGLCDGGNIYPGLN